MNRRRPLLLIVIAWSVLWVGGGPARADFTTVINNGPTSNRVDMVFLGDGYTAGEMGTAYTSHISAMTDYMFTPRADWMVDPFPRYAGFFNVHRIDVVSNQSGADKPWLSQFVDTALDGSYAWGGGPERLLYVSHSKATNALNAALAGAGFSAEMRMVTVNDTTYGGGGGFYAVYAGGHASSPEISLHELAHSFSNLADEYDYGGPTTYTGPEPSEPNITINPAGTKWAQWLGYDQPGIGTIGTYEGAGYSQLGIYRPSDNSKMRALNRPFDAISREQIILDIYSLVDPLDSWTDNSTQLTDPLLEVLGVDADVISVQWYVDGELINGATDWSFDPADYVGPGEYLVTAHAFDDTDWIRINTELLEQSVTWSVALTPEPAGALILLVGVAGLLRRRRVGGSC